MQQYIFVKKSPSIQLGHLYEHIISMSLVDYLSSKKLYRYVDYDLIAKTYHGGLISLEFHIYKKSIKIQTKLLDRLDLELDDRRLEVALHQVSAELSRTPVAYNTGKLIQQMDELHAKRWQSLDKFTDLDANNIPGNLSKYDIFTNTPIRTNKLKVVVKSAEKESSHQNMAPLTRQLSKLIAENLTDAFCDTFGLFNSGDAFENGILTSTLLTDSQSIDLNDGYLTITENLLETMHRQKVFTRFTRHLRNMSYEKRPLDAVNFESNYEDTLIFIGSKGWRKIATDENARSILNNLSIEITFKSHSITVPMPS